MPQPVTLTRHRQAASGSDARTTGEAMLSQSRDRRQSARRPAGPSRGRASRSRSCLAAGSRSAQEKTPTVTIDTPASPISAISSAQMSFGPLFWVVIATEGDTWHAGPGWRLLELLRGRHSCVSLHRTRHVHTRFARATASARSRIARLPPLCVAQVGLVDRAGTASKSRSCSDTDSIWPDYGASETESQPSRMLDRPPSERFAVSASDGSRSNLLCKRSRSPHTPSFPLTTLMEAPCRTPSPVRPARSRH